VKDYITLHPLNRKPYYLGVFFTGAYQDIMGDLHNLFGRVNEIHVFLEEDEAQRVLHRGGARRQPRRRCHRGRAIPAGGALPPDEAADRPRHQERPREAREGVRWLEFYEAQMLAKTYLNIGPKNARKRRAGGASEGKAKKKES